MEVVGGHVGSFMEQLGTLCRHLDREVEQLKEELNHSPGKKPYHYDPAMKKLKKDVEELKSSSAEAKSKLASMDNFSSFLETTTELVDEQEKSITKMEEYLQKFGYKPLEMSLEVKDENKENSPCEKKLEVSSQRPSAGHITSPVLSEVGRSVIQGKDITQNLANIINMKKKLSLKENPMYKVSKNEMELEPKNRNEENQANDLDANQYSGRPLPFSEKIDSSIINEQRNIIQDLPNNRTMLKDNMSSPTMKFEHPSTPATPEFSEATMSLLNLIKKENTDHNDTYVPDEPSMHYVETKNQFGSLNDTGIPDEPVLSNIYGKMQLVDTPEEPKLLAVRNTDNIHNTPESPVLSEATMSLFRCIPPKSHILLAHRDIEKNIESHGFSNGTKVHANLVSQKDYFGHSNDNTPEEPTLNYDYSGKHSYSSKNTPEEPILSSTCTAASSNIDDDMPPSPELSSYTQSFLKSQTHVRATQHSDMRRNVYESVIDREYSNENMNRSHQTNELPNRYKHQVKDHNYGAHTQNEYLEQENDENTSYVSNSSYMNKSGGGANFSFITPAKERGNVNRSYSLAMERLANVNDSPESPQLSDISMSIVNRSQRW